MPNHRYRFSLAPLLTLALVALLALAEPALADGDLVEAQYNCAPKAGLFTLLPYAPADIDAPPAPPEPGYMPLQDGISRLDCHLGQRRVQVQIVQRPPRPRGMCAGAGGVEIESVAVDGVEILYALPFNECNFDGIQTSKVQVRIKGRHVALTQCKSIEQENAPAQTRCTTKAFPVDAIAAAHARIDHDLASPAVQSVQSALKLPPENDLARRYPQFLPADSSIPLCAHWFDLFNGRALDEGLRHGRIAGAVGERVFIHPANPQLCDGDQSERCTPKAYVIPGDRVDVGFICGKWTQVLYESRLHSKPDTQGWIETARLYGVDPYVVTASPPAPSQPDPADPLLRAILHKDSATVQRLLARGADVNAVTLGDTPLSFAVRQADPAMVKQLLKSGARVSQPLLAPKRACDLVSDSLRHPELFALLLAAGMDVNCQNNEGTTALINAAGGYREFQWHHQAEGLYGQDLADEVRLLLAAHARVNLHYLSGETALSRAVEASNADIVQLLLDAGADPNAVLDGGLQQMPSGGGTALMEAIKSYRQNLDPTIVQLLLEHGARPDYKNPLPYDDDWDQSTSDAMMGQTPLTRAVEDGSYTLARLLLEHGADPTITREDGATLLELAAPRHDPALTGLINRYLARH